MKEPVALYILDRLEYSQEVLLYKEPKELSLTIWIKNYCCQFADLVVNCIYGYL